MAVEPKKYDYNDLREIGFNEIPSLDIPHIRTDKVLTPKDGSPYLIFLAQIDKKYRPKNGCPYCHSDDLKLEGLASKPRLVHDVTRNNMRVDLLIYAPRMSCKTCKAKFTPEVAGIKGSRQMTTRLDEYIRKECFLQPFTILSERSGLSTYTISNIMDEEIEKYEAKRRAHPPKAPRVLGIDEKYLSHEARGTLVDVESGKLLDIMPDNKKETMIEAIKALKDWNKNIKVVTVDMNSGYASWLSELLPDVTIVIDKFHVIKNVETAVTQSRKPLIEYRKKLLKENPNIKERARHEEILGIVTKHPRLFNYTLARLAREGMEERKKQLATVINEFPEFKMLHNLRYYSEYLYEQTSRDDAEKVWNDWYDIMPPGGPKQFKEWCDLYLFDDSCFRSWQSFSRHGFLRFKPYILNYFNSAETRVTNAATEGVNSLITDINIAGKGYSFPHLRAKCLYASLINERKVYGINVKSFGKWTTKDARMAFMYSGRFDALSLNSMTEKIHIPELNIYSDNEWLTGSINDDYVRERDRTLFSVKSMDKSNELPGEQETFIYELNVDSFPE